MAMVTYSTGFALKDDQFLIIIKKNLKKLIGWTLKHAKILVLLLLNLSFSARLISWRSHADYILPAAAWPAVKFSLVCSGGSIWTEPVNTTLNDGGAPHWTQDLASVIPLVGLEGAGIETVHARGEGLVEMPRLGAVSQHGEEDYIVNS